MKQFVRLRTIFITSLLVTSLNTSNSVAVAQTNSAYLPLVLSAPRVEPLFFGADNNCDDTLDGNFITSPAVVPRGVIKLFTATTITGAVGREYRFEWIVDDVLIEDLKKDGTIQNDVESVGMSVVFGVNGVCGDPLPFSTFEVRLYLDNVLYQVGGGRLE